MRDASISGFTGAKWEIFQLAGQSNDTTGSVSHHTFPMVSGEVQFVVIDWIMAKADFSMTAAGTKNGAFKKVASLVSTVSQGTPGGALLRDNSNTNIGLFFATITAGAFDINITSDSSANTWNWFANVRILHMMTNT
jgi:hypothetical protein